MVRTVVVFCLLRPLIAPKMEYEIHAFTSDLPSPKLGF